MTTDAVGGVWRYSVDLARTLNAAGIEVALACLGPEPAASRRAEVATLGGTELVCLDQPLDWLAAEPGDLAAVPRVLAALADRYDVDLLHLNTPSQAAGLVTGRPVVVVSHSCVVTWWDAMRGTPLPVDWHWQYDITRRALAAADAVVAPSQSHAAALQATYGITAVRVVPNATATDALNAAGGPLERQPFVLAAARWWDEGKNAAVLDAAAAASPWPILAAGACRGANGESFAFRHAQTLGELGQSAMAERLGTAAIFVSPSRYEPFGLAALEAAATGAALVLADIPTYRELWHGAALFFDPLDPRALSGAIAKLAADPATLRLWADRAGRQARRYTPDRQLRALLAAYAAAAKARSGQQHAEPALAASARPLSVPAE
ncbi:glycosyltransferase [Mangrovicella endophytica]|uniref:glycosyltransferase n=1 Tax=Mangrovicella endophytica TaxID=2066697 RepID=UPI0018E460ED|nr:glycosyltransferase [Mangrovicella endophytica]